MMNIVNSNNTAFATCTNILCLDALTLIHIVIIMSTDYVKLKANYVIQ